MSINLEQPAVLDSFFSHPILQQLMENESELVDEALIDLFRTGLPSGQLAVERAALEFVERQVRHRGSNLRLWFYVIRDSCHL